MDAIFPFHNFKSVVLFPKVPSVVTQATHIIHAFKTGLKFILKN